MRSLQAFSNIIFAVLLMLSSNAYCEDIPVSLKDFDSSWTREHWFFQVEKTREGIQIFENRDVRGCFTYNCFYPEPFEEAIKQHYEVFGKISYGVTEGYNKKKLNSVYFCRNSKPETTCLRTFVEGTEKGKMKKCLDETRKLLQNLEDAP